MNITRSFSPQRELAPAGLRRMITVTAVRSLPGGWLWTGALLCVLLAQASAARAADLGLGRVSLVQGQVQLQPQGDTEWSLAPINMPVREGDRYWTPDGARLELQFQDGTVVRLNERSSLDVLRLDNALLQVHLRNGQLYFLAGQDRDAALQVDLPDTTLVLQGRARFRVDVRPDGREEISIFRGSLQVVSSGTRTQVRTGEMLTLNGDSAEVSPLDQPDDWERWNLARDRQQQGGRAGSAQYLPDELTAYADDLDENGEWIYEAEYGYCWRPRVALSIGWAPYRLGRWVWIGGDYCWISFEPWGWGPYHYGRWAWTSGRWCWVPPARHKVYWSPGYVGWVRTPDHVAWVPLGPRDIYYGYGHFGPNSIDLRGPNVSIDLDFGYLSLHHAITGVPTVEFATGRGRPAPFPKRSFAPGHLKPVGHPDIKPRPEASRIGPPAPGHVQPRREIRTVDLSRVRERYPLVRPVPNRSGDQDRPQDPRTGAPRPSAPAFPEGRGRMPDTGTRPGARNEQDRIAPQEQRRAAPQEQRRAAPQEQRRAAPQEQRRVAPQEQRRVAPVEEGSVFTAPVQDNQRSKRTWNISPRQVPESGQEQSIGQTRSNNKGQNAAPSGDRGQRQYDENGRSGGRGGGRQPR